MVNFCKFCGEIWSSAPGDTAGGSETLLQSKQQIVWQIAKFVKIWVEMSGESENFQSCLQTVVELRSKTANAIKTASDGTHGKEKKFLSELKLTMDVVNSHIK